jgi:predicted deacylase
LFGRFELDTGINFNRNFMHLSPALIAQLDAQLGPDEATNTRLIRRSCKALLEAWQPQTEAEALKRLLQSLAIDADIVLDLHCDHQAVPHVYAATQQAAAAQPLAAYLGARALLVAKVSGGDPFDEANSRIWFELAEHFAGRAPVADACLSLTVELRGEQDVEHGLAEQDAQAVIEFLRHAGHIGGSVQPLPPALCEPTPLEGVEPITAPHAGLLVYFKAPGDHVEVGEAIGEVIDPSTDQVTPLRAKVAGLLYARISRRYATRGMRVAKVAGTQAFRSGKLLSM